MRHEFHDDVDGLAVGHDAVELDDVRRVELLHDGGL